MISDLTISTKSVREKISLAELAPIPYTGFDGRNVMTAQTAVTKIHGRTDAGLRSEH